MMRRFGMAAATVFAGLMSAVSGVSAQTIDVPFNGFVGNVCTFDNLTAGVLATNSTAKTILSSTQPGGSDATVRLNCNGSARISVGDMVAENTLSANLLAGTTVSLSSRGTSVYQSNDLKAQTSNGVAQTVTANTVTFSGSPISLRVQMFINANSTMPGGAYSFTVPVTATPL